MKLWAISDLHVGHVENRQVIARMEPHRDDWLVLGGDVGETLDHLRFTLEMLVPRFARVLWVPGNHELWAVPESLYGETRYRELVALCRRYGALTPEDPYPVFDDGAGAPHLVAPLFTLYDYTFSPDGMGPQEALAWALESGLVCADEAYLRPDPYPTRQAWCAARCDYTEARLADARARHPGPVVLVNHFPLLQELAVLPLIPRFSIWCGTRRTRDWHRRFGATVVVSGHLHMAGTRYVDGVRFEEVSLGYPRQWRRWRPDGPFLRQILPSPEPAQAAVTAPRS